MKVGAERHFVVGNFKAILGLAFLLALSPVVFFGGQGAVALFSQAAPVPANIVVDAAKSQGVMPRPWEGLSEGGEQEVPGKLVSLAPVAGQVKTLGVRYIRIDHALEEPFYGSLRERVQEIVNAGATPFIALSYFPSSVADSNIGTVRDWNAWQARVRSTVEMVSGRSGMNIAGVYYEVWNEPDGSGFGGFSIGGGKDYFTLYQKTVEAVNQAQNVNSFKVGGPALADLRRCTNGLLFVCQEFWLDKFLSLVAADHVRLDFISWHKYATNLTDYQEDVNFIMGLYSKYKLPKVEKVITEWGSVPERSGVHNTNYDAAHEVAAARAFIGYVDLATKFEIRDGPDSGSGGWGILYHDGTKKPTFEALRLLGQMRVNRLAVSGEGTNVTAIASRDSSGVTAIVVNYDRAGVNTETVPVATLHLTPGSYRLTKETVSSLYPLGKNETTTFTTADGSFETKELMLPNSVVYFDLQLISLLTSGK